MRRHLAHVIAWLADLPVDDPSDRAPMASITYLETKRARDDGTSGPATQQEWTDGQYAV